MENLDVFSYLRKDNSKPTFVLEGEEFTINKHYSYTLLLTEVIKI